MVGDLALAGAPLRARFTGHRSGHALNNRLLRALFADQANWRELPSFGIGQSSASNAQQFDLYGLARRASATVLASDYYRGPSGGDTTDATLIQSAFISTTDIFVANAVTSTNAAGGTALADYLNAQYASGAGAGQVVFLRMNVTDAYTTTNTRLSPHSVEAATSTLRPVINYTAAIPEPAAMGFLTLCAAGALLPRRRR